MSRAMPRNVGFIDTVVLAEIEPHTTGVSRAPANRFVIWADRGEPNGSRNYLHASCLGEINLEDMRENAVRSTAVANCLTRLL